MANQYDGNLSRADNIDVFAQLSHLLEANYLHDSQSPSSSRERTSIPTHGRSKSKISSGNVINYPHGDKFDGKGSFLAPSNRESSSTNGVISFQAWQSKIQGNKNSTADKLTRIRRADVSSKSATSCSSELLSQSTQSKSDRWSGFLDRVNQKENEKRRSIKNEQWRLDAAENEECFFSPNLTTKSLIMAADFAQLKDRIPRVLTAREDFLEQQRLMLAEREAAECTFTPNRAGAYRSDRYLLNSSNLLTSPENYKPYLDERSRKDEILRSQIAERDSAEFTFQPKTNSSKILAARSKRLINAKREREKQIAKDKERQFFFASSADAGAKDENIFDSQIPASGGDSQCSLKELGNVPNKGLDTEMEVIEKETKEEIKKDKKKVIEKNEVFAFNEDGKGVIEKDEMEGDERDGKEKYKIKEIEQDEMEEIGKDKNDGMEKYVIEEIEGDEEVEIEKLEEDDLERDRKDDIERDGKEEIEGDEKEGTEKDEIEEIGDDDKERIESDGTVEIEKDDGDFPLKKQENIAKNIVTVSVQTQTLSINESCTVVTSNEIIVEDNEVDAIICEDTEFEENNCHERLYRMGVDHHSRIAQIHELAHRKDSRQIDDSISSRAHPTCERLYRDGLQKLATSMPTTEQNISCTYKSLSCWPAPFSPCAIDPQHPFKVIPRSRSKSRPRPQGITGSSSSSGHPGPCDKNPSLSPQSSDSISGVKSNVMKEGGGQERENVVIDKESIKRRYLGSYVTVVDCNSEETAEHSSDYLRDLWTDLKSS